MHPLMYCLRPHCFQVAQSNFYGRDVQVVERAIFKRRLTLCQIIPVALHGSDGDSTTSEPWATQFGECLATRQQAADACRIAKHLVKRDRHKIGMPQTKVQAISCDKCGGIQHHIPPSGLSHSNPCEWMLHP